MDREKTLKDALYHCRTGARKLRRLSEDVDLPFDVWEAVGWAAHDAKGLCERIEEAVYLFENQDVPELTPDELLDEATRL